MLGLIFDCDDIEFGRRWKKEAAEERRWMGGLGDRAARHGHRRNGFFLVWLSGRSARGWVFWVGMRR